MDFIDESARAVSSLKSTSPLFSQHVNLLQSVASRLRDLHDDPEAGPSPDYLFFASFAYVYRLLICKSGTITTEAARNLILAISQYRERVALRKDIEDGFYNSFHDDWTFDKHWFFFANRAKALGIVVPSPAQEPPAECALIQDESDHPSCDAVVEVLHDHHASRSSLKTDDG